MALLSESLELDTEELKSIWYNGIFFIIDVRNERLKCTCIIIVMKVARCGKVH
jgi:hypothetical protein